MMTVLSSFLVLGLVICSSFQLVTSTYHSKIQNPFPLPLYPEGNRTAVILSGQLRVANYTILSSNVRGYHFKANVTDYFGPDDPTTTILTQLEHFLRPYAEYGGVDLFIYIQSLPGMQMNASWDGRAETYEAAPGDKRPCELYSSSPIFARHTKNKVFCLVEPPHILSDHFIKSFPIWNSFHGGNGPEPFLQQLYGMYRGNLAAKEYSKMQDFYYRYKARIRPDIAFIKPMPLPYALRPVYNPERPCEGPTVYYPPERLFGVSATDSFNFGDSLYMDYILDRYMYFLVDHHKPRLCMVGNHHKWSSECHDRYYLQDLYNACLKESDDIVMMKLQQNAEEYHVPFETFHEIDWIDMTPE